MIKQKKQSEQQHRKPPAITTTTIASQNQYKQRIAGQKNVNSTSHTNQNSYENKRSSSTSNNSNNRQPKLSNNKDNPVSVLTAYSHRNSRTHRREDLSSKLNPRTDNNLSNPSYHNQQQSSLDINDASEIVIDENGHEQSENDGLMNINTNSDEATNDDDKFQEVLSKKSKRQRMVQKAGEASQKTEWDERERQRSTSRRLQQQQRRGTKQSSKNTITVDATDIPSLASIDTSAMAVYMNRRASITSNAANEAGNGDRDADNEDMDISGRMALSKIKRFITTESNGPTISPLLMNTMESLSLDSTTVTTPGLDIATKSPPLPLLDDLNITASAADPIWLIKAEKKQSPPPNSSLDSENDAFNDVGENHTHTQAVIPSPIARPMSKIIHKQSSTQLDEQQRQRNLASVGYYGSNEQAAVTLASADNDRTMQHQQRNEAESSGWYPTPHQYTYPERCTTNSGKTYSSVVQKEKRGSASNNRQHKLSWPINANKMQHPPPNSSMDSENDVFHDVGENYTPVVIPSPIARPMSKIIHKQSSTLLDEQQQQTAIANVGCYGSNEQTAATLGLADNDRTMQHQQRNEAEDLSTSSGWYPTLHHHQSTYPERCTTINNNGKTYSSIVQNEKSGRPSNNSNNRQHKLSWPINAKYMQHPPPHSSLDSENDAFHDVGENYTPAVIPSPIARPMSKIIHEQQFLGSIFNGDNGITEFHNQPTQYHPHQKQLNPLHQQQHENGSCIEMHMGQGYQIVTTTRSPHHPHSHYPMQHYNVNKFPPKIHSVTSSDYIQPQFGPAHSSSTQLDKQQRQREFVSVGGYGWDEQSAATLGLADNDRTMQHQQRNDAENLSTSSGWYPTPHHHQYPERCTTINNGGTNYSSVVADIGIGRGISPQMLCAPTGSLLPLNFTQPSQFLSNYSRPPPLYSNFSPPPPYVPNFAQPPPVPWPLCQRDMPQMDHPPTTDICSSVKEMKKIEFSRIPLNWND